MIRRIVLAVAGLAAGIAVGIALGWLAERYQIEEAKPYMTADLDKLPSLDVGLVLGTAPLDIRRGVTRPNVPFVYRLEAGAELWKAGKVKYLIVSGNRTGDYDEPSAMRDGLIQRGVPADVIYRDFAGYRTNDSVVRAQETFGQKKLVIVSQTDHVARAVLLARAAGLEAWGFEARDEPRRLTVRDRLGHYGWALRARWDIWWGTRPRELGTPVIIGADRPS